MVRPKKDAADTKRGRKEAKQLEMARNKLDKEGKKWLAAEGKCKGPDGRIITFEEACAAAGLTIEEGKPLNRRCFLSPSTAIQPVSG